MNSCFVVIGTGRSGTSLAMQALAALGLRLDHDLVPPGENNLVSTGEAIVVRDVMVDLNVSLGRANGFRPDGWLDHPGAQTCLGRLSGYLADQASRAGSSGFAVKFPLASMFLPLWQRAAEEAGIELRFIWATRRATGTIHSLTAAYGSPPKIARLRYAQRCYYILRDAPGHTLLLPYEGWYDNLDGQVGALAKLTGVEDADRLIHARSVFRKSLDHSPKAPEMELPAAIAALDQKLTGQRGRLRAIFDRGTPEHLRLMTTLADLVAELQPSPSLGHSDDEHEMRLRLISKLAETSPEESPEMNEQIDILTQRIRDVNAENRKLKQSGSPAGETASHEDIQRSHEVNGALVQQLTDTLSALRESQGDLQAAREQVIATERAKAEALGELHEQAGELRARLARGDNQREILKEQVATLTSERNTLASKLAEQEKALDELKQQMAVVEDKLRESEAALSEAQSQFETRFEALTDDLAAKEGEVSALTSERDALTEHLAEQELALKLAEENIAAGKDAYARLTIERDALEEEIESRMRQKMHELETREAKHRLDAQTLRNINKKLKDQIETQKQQLAQHEKRTRALEAVLHTAQAAAERGTADAREKAEKLADTVAALQHAHHKGKVLAQLGGIKERLTSALSSPLDLRRRKKARSKINEDMCLVSTSVLFDAEWYLQRYPDVAQTKVEPLYHFVRYGAYELRDPGPDFDSLKYHLANPDVAAHGMTGLVHYLRIGKSEGRSCIGSTGKKG